ncbi:MAG: single-stranded-DNA-specific exonuclease RecJ [Patescibacteria group bacterium]|nr:single-stranded-DNA-specific exonuclease RecJ [Patescibacteria group bacterium]MDE1965915.1 single-stranded-DNA-specific exonuclease RecJ [Patescibacteria group bacterium]
MSPFHEPIDEGVRAELAEHDDLIAALLARRGIRTKEAADAFLDPSYDAHLGDPLLMRDMEKGARRIAKAIAEREKIAIWSDYDCDGIPGGVLLHDFLKKAGADFTNYIPHRHLEGYGVNVSGIGKLAAQGVSLVITVDVGITDSEAVARANELGMDVIVTDHHLPEPEGLPPAYAVIDPKREDETYPFRDFCGAGLAWKLVTAVLALGRAEGAPWCADIPEGWEKWLLDMAGLATIADMVPLTGENRVIAKYGLLVMRKSPRLGLQKLCRGMRVNQSALSEDDVGFMVAPRVNAASRMGEAADAFRLFTTEDEAEADALAKKLEKLNRERRAQAGAITRAAHERLSGRTDLGSVIVLGDPAWKPSLLGLVANGIAEEFGRPTFLWGREGSGVLKGSCRGAGVTHVVELMQEAKDAFAEFGGHAQSGGFSVKDEEIFSLEERLTDAHARLLAKNAEREREDRKADAELALSDATPEFLGKLERLAPFGQMNEKPVFLFREVSVMRVLRFGKGNEHVKIRFAHADSPVMLEGIAFFAKRALGPAGELLADGDRVNVLAHIERDQFSRNQSLRLRIVSIA